MIWLLILTAFSMEWLCDWILCQDDDESDVLHNALNAFEARLGLSSSVICFWIGYFDWLFRYDTLNWVVQE